MNKVGSEIIKNQNKKVVSTIDVKKLRDTEQSILNYMLVSFENYQYALKSLKRDDFTFLVHRLIYITLCDLEDYIFEESNEEFDINFINKLIGLISYILDKEQNLVKEFSLKNILTQVPSIDIEKDLNEILFYSLEKQQAISNHTEEDSIIQFDFEDLNSITIAAFKQNRLIEVRTSNIDHIPNELKDTATDTMRFMIEADLENSDIEISFSSGNTEPLGYMLFNIKKDFSLLEKRKVAYKSLFNWANKYNFEEDVFPRNIEEIRELIELDLSNKKIEEIPKELVLLNNLTFLDMSFNKIKSIPDELGNMDNLRFINLEANDLESVPNGIINKTNLLLLSLKRNKITYIPKEISNLKLLTHLCLCCNKVEEIPEEISELKNLSSFCIHRNKLSTIPSKITELINLKSLTFSNNYIKELPRNLEKLNNLESLNFENNVISKININFLRLPKLNEIAFDDNLFTSNLNDLHLLSNIDTIDLSASKIDMKSEDFKKLSLDTELVNWVEDEDKRENGCIKLFNKKENNNEN